jgi:hypothetical protein
MCVHINSEMQIALIFFLQLSYLGFNLFICLYVIPSCPPPISFFAQVLHLTLVSAVQLATAFTQRTARQRDAISAFMSLEEEGALDIHTHKRKNERESEWPMSNEGLDNAPTRS